MVKSERVGDVFLFLLSYTCWKELVECRTLRWGGEDAARSRESFPPPTASENQNK